MITIPSRSVQYPPNPYPGYPPIPVTCKNSTKTNTAVTCGSYVTNYIQSLTGNLQASKVGNDDGPDLPLDAGYSSYQIPARYFSNGTVEPLYVYMSLQLDTFQYIDTQNGIISIDANIDLWWYDYRLNWNNTNTHDIDCVYVESSWVWTPDITLFNQADGNSIPPKPVKLYSDGLIHLSTKGYLKATCLLNLDLYPFDNQTCSFTFASWNYLSELLILKVQPAQFEDDDDDYYTLEALRWKPSISWYVSNFNCSDYLAPSGYEGGEFSYASWNLTAFRYSTYYISTAIMPDFTVSLVCILSLWIPSIDTRLSISITGLLTIIAVMWTITASLPVTERATWISRFSNFCVIIVGVICVETAFIAYFETKTGTPPRWMRTFISYTNVFSWIYIKVFAFFVENCCDCFCIFYNMVSSKPVRRRRAKRTNNVMTASFFLRPSIFGPNIGIDHVKKDIDKRTNNVMTASFFSRPSTIGPNIGIDHVKKDIEMNSMNKNQTENNNDSDDEIFNGDESKQEPSNTAVEVINPAFFITKIEKLDKNDDDIKQEEDDDDIQEGQLMLPKEVDTELDWIRFGRAVDRISRFVLPVAFIVGTFTLYNETSNHCIPGLDKCYNDKIEGMKY